MDPELPVWDDGQSILTIPESNGVDYYMSVRDINLPDWQNEPQVYEKVEAGEYSEFTWTNEIIFKVYAKSGYKLAEDSKLYPESEDSDGIGEYYMVGSNSDETGVSNGLFWHLYTKELPIRNGSKVIIPESKYFKYILSEEEEVDLDEFYENPTIPGEYEVGEGSSFVAIAIIEDWVVLTNPEPSQYGTGQYPKHYRYVSESSENDFALIPDVESD